MEYKEILTNAKKNMEKCKACDICNGLACKNMIPGPGAKGVGDTAIRNYNKWQEIRLNMDVIHDNNDIDTTINIFNREFALPIFAGPVGAIANHYGDKYNDISYNDILVKACAQNGILAFTGDGLNPEVMKSATDAIAKYNGIGIPTIKPWHIDVIKEKMSQAINANAIAIAMDVDASGLPFLKNATPKAGFKNIDELKEIINLSNKPFIVKGIMTKKAALKAIEAGAYAIVVSNHGGRVLDSCLSTAEVLKDIASVAKGKVKIIVDGGIRSGSDIFKALALGADAVIIARPFVTMVYGNEEEAVKTYINKLENELKDVMAMCGANSLAEINEDMIYIPWSK